MKKKPILIKLTFRYYLLTADITLPFLVSILRPNVLQSNATYIKFGLLEI